MGAPGAEEGCQRHLALGGLLRAGAAVLSGFYVVHRRDATYGVSSVGLRSLSFFGSNLSKRTSLKHGPAAALHLLVAVGQLGETVAHFLLCCGSGAQAFVGGHYLARSAPGGLGVVEVRTVLGRITELPAFRGHGLPLYPNIRPTMMTTY